MIVAASARCCGGGTNAALDEGVPEERRARRRERAWESAGILAECARIMSRVFYT